MFTDSRTPDWDTLYKPTDHFKKFCGSEWLNTERQTSKRNAYIFVQKQIEWRKPLENNCAYQMLPYFQDLFERKQAFFTMKEVEEWIEDFMEKDI